MYHGKVGQRPQTIQNITSGANKSQYCYFNSFSRKTKYTPYQKINEFDNPPNSYPDFSVISSLEFINNIKI